MIPNPNDRFGFGIEPPLRRRPSARMRTPGEGPMKNHTKSESIIRISYEASASSSEAQESASAGFSAVSWKPSSCAVICSGVRASVITVTWSTPASR